MSTITRRRRNKVEGLRDDNGIWHTNLEELRKVATMYFQSLFTPSYVASTYSFQRFKSGQLNAMKLSQLYRYPSF